MNRNILIQNREKQCRNHTPARIPVIVSPGTVLLQNDSRHPGLLLKFPRRGIPQIFLQIHKTARQCPASNIRMISPSDHQQLQPGSAFRIFPKSLPEMQTKTTMIMVSSA